MTDTWHAGPTEPFEVTNLESGDDARERPWNNSRRDMSNAQGIEVTMEHESGFPARA